MNLQIHRNLKNKLSFFLGRKKNEACIYLNLFYSIYYILETMYSIVYTIYLNLFYSIYYILETMHSIVYTIYLNLFYSIYYILVTMYSIVYTTYLKLCIL